MSLRATESGTDAGHGTSGKPKSAAQDATQKMKSDIAVRLRRLKEKEARYKKLLVGVKKALTEKKKELEQKDRVIEQLRVDFTKQLDLSSEQQQDLQDDVVSLQKELATAQAKVMKEAGGGSRASRTQEALPEPRWVLQRVIEPSGPGSGRVWCLVGWRTPKHSSGEVSGWELESELQARAHRDYSTDLSMPPITPNAEEIAQIQDEYQSCQGDLKKAKHDFRRYRVRAELTIRQKETALNNAQRELDMNFGNKIREIAGTDLAGNLKRAQAEIQWLKKNLDEAAQRNKLTVEEVAMQKREIQEQKASLGEAFRERDDWQARYEEGAMERRGRDLVDAVEDGATAVADLEELQQQFAEHRRRATVLAQEQARALEDARARLSYMEKTQAATAAAHPTNGGVPPADGGGTKGQYLRNIVLQYMSAEDDDVRSRLEAALGQILQFTPAEAAAITARKRSTAWGFLGV